MDLHRQLAEMIVDAKRYLLVPVITAAALGCDVPPELEPKATVVTETHELGQGPGGGGGGPPGPANRCFHRCFAQCLRHCERQPTEGGGIWIDPACKYACSESCREGCAR